MYEEFAAYLERKGMAGNSVRAYLTGEFLFILHKNTEKYCVKRPKKVKNFYTSVKRFYNKFLAGNCTKKGSKIELTHQAVSRSGETK